MRDVATYTDQHSAQCHPSRYSSVLARSRSSPQAAEGRKLLATQHFRRFYNSTCVPLSSELFDTSHCSNGPVGNTIWMSSYVKTHDRKKREKNKTQKQLRDRPFCTERKIYPPYTHRLRTTFHKLRGCNHWSDKSFHHKILPSAFMSSLHPSLSSGGSQG